MCFLLYPHGSPDHPIPITAVLPRFTSVLPGRYPERSLMSSTESLTTNAVYIGAGRIYFYVWRLYYNGIIMSQIIHEVDILNSCLAFSCQVLLTSSTSNYNFYCFFCSTSIYQSILCILCSSYFLCFMCLCVCACLRMSVMGFAAWFM